MTIGNAFGGWEVREKCGLMGGVETGKGFLGHFSALSREMPVFRACRGRLAPLVPMAMKLLPLLSKLPY